MAIDVILVVIIKIARIKLNYERLSLIADVPNDHLFIFNCYGIVHHERQIALCYAINTLPSLSFLVS